MYLGAEQLHAEDVEGLALDVDLAHIDDALETEQRRRGGCGHAVLAGAGFGDHAALAHPPGEQRLADDVVDLVGAGVGQVFALEQNAHAEALGEPLALGHRRWAARVVAQDRGVFGAESVVGPGVDERLLEFLARGNERLGDELASEVAKPATGCRLTHEALCLRRSAHLRSSRQS